MSLSGWRGFDAGAWVDSRLDRLFSALDSSFSAAIDRSEDEAANDLALSLTQDLSLELQLVGRSATLIGEPSVPVAEVGRDFVRTGDHRLLPLAAHAYRVGPSGPGPVRTDSYLVDVLRRAVRSASRISVEGAFGAIEGPLVHCGPDHIGVSEGESDVLIPLKSVRVIRLSHEDSAGVS